MIALNGDSGEVLSLYQCSNWLTFSAYRMEKLILKMRRKRKNKRRKKRKMGRKTMRMKKKVRKNLTKMKRMLPQIATLILNLTLRVKKLQGIQNRRNTKQMKMHHRMWRN